MTNFTEAEIEHEQDRLIDLLVRTKTSGDRLTISKATLDSALADLDEHVADATRYGRADTDLTSLLESAESWAREVNDSAERLRGDIIEAARVADWIDGATS